MLPTMRFLGALVLISGAVKATPIDTVTWEEYARQTEAGLYNATGIDSSEVTALNMALGLHKRQSVDCNNRPSDINANAICGPRFVGMASKGWGPALEAMPQFDHARLDGSHFSCYPESAANAAGDGPNPGEPAPYSGGSLTVNPNRGCRDPNAGATYGGPLSRGQPFPIYVRGVYCPGSTTWRIMYSLYYPQDYTHRHDWEHVVVVFGKDVNNGGKRDWWARTRLLLSQHSGFNKLPWSSATAHNDPYSGSPTRGDRGAHPRVFVGMYKHAMWNEAKTSCVGPGCASEGSDEEYRRNSWIYTPVVGNIRNSRDTPPQAWGDYNGKTPPWKLAQDVCGL